MLRLGVAEKFEQFIFGRVALDKRVESGAGAPIGKGHDRNVANTRMGAQARRDRGGLPGKANAATLTVSEIQSSGNGVVQFFAAGHPYPRDKRLARQNTAFRYR